MGANRARRQGSNDVDWPPPERRGVSSRPAAPRLDGVGDSRFDGLRLGRCPAQDVLKRGAGDGVILGRREDGDAAAAYAFAR